MPKASSHGYYAVRTGRVPGIYHSWADCEAQIKGFPGATYKKLSTEMQANEFMAAKSTTARRDIIPVASTSRAMFTLDAKIHSTSQDEIDCDIVYCDGACKGNGKPGSIAGIGVWWGHGDPRNISERCPGDQTNNRAELIAIVRILETTPYLRRRLLIKTDSKYSIQCVTEWISKWMRNGFLAADGEPVKNRALIKYLVALLHVRRKTSQIIEFRHVRGHIGIEGNEAADQLAKMGATQTSILDRDWEKLEKQVLQSLKPVEPIEEMDDDLKAYADGLLNDGDLAELADTRISSPESATHAFVSPVQVLPRLATATVRKSELPSRGSCGPTTAVFTKKPTTSISKEELEVFASCLLGDDDLSTLGKDGMFDSDF